MNALNHKITGSGPAVIIIHGLFGDMNNLGNLARALIEQQRWQVIQVDVRNHGGSFHHQEMDYPCMAADLAQLMDQLRLEQATLVGHSMGGKIAMQLALQHPDRVTKLVVADIAPVPYSAHHKQVFAALDAIDTQRPTSRKQADVLMQQHVEEVGVRQFLLKNLQFTDGNMGWRLNLTAIRDCYPQILDWQQPNQTYAGDTLFIKGGDSDYILPDHQQAIMTQFPNARAKIISDAGHWLHAQKPQLFNRLALNFLD